MRALRLHRLYADDATPAVALAHLAAAHAGAPELRAGFVHAGPKVFPAPRAVPGLLTLLLTRLAQTAASARDAEDDVYVAAAALYGVTAIHPFADGNGRTAVDFAQYLLMLRWGEPAPPLALPSDAHRLFARVLVPLDRAAHDDAHDDNPRSETEALAHRIGGATLDWLRSCNAFRVVAQCMAEASLVPLKEKSRCPSFPMVQQPLGSLRVSSRLAPSPPPRPTQRS